MHGEAEVTDLGDTLGGEPDVAGLEVAVDDAVVVGEFEASGGGEIAMSRGLLEWERCVSIGSFEELLDVTAGPISSWTRKGWLRAVLGGVLADVVDGDDVLVGEAAHRLRLAHDPLAAGVVDDLRS